MGDFGILIIGVVDTFFAFFVVAPMMLQAASLFGVQKQFAKAMVQEGVVTQEAVDRIHPKKQIAGVLISLVLFAVLISVTFGFAFNSVQSNTICAAWEGAFGADHVWAGVVLTALTLLIIFGGIRRIARVSGVIVPIMALGYIVLALGVVLFNLGRLPEVLELIVADAFGWEQTLGGAVGAALMQGIKRGLFSNEAGMGSAPNVAATAHVSHPVKQGLIQTLGVFTDTLVICTCTAFIIRFITPRPWALTLYRLLVGAMVLFGSVATLDLAWSLADVTMALMTLCNLAAIVLLGRQAFLLLADYTAQKRQGIKNPVFTKDRIPELKDKAECW